jgi:hypothetical protein
LTDISPEVIETVEQLTDTWRAFVTDHGPGDVRDLPGMAIRWADSKFPFWNCITFTDQGAAYHDFDFGETLETENFRRRTK